jgi:hypothetical protein
MIKPRFLMPRNDQVIKELAGSHRTTCFGPVQA